MSDEANTLRDVVSSTNPTRTALSRRTILRGAGAALALPLLEAMIPKQSFLRSAAAAGLARTGAPVVAPTRMMFVFLPNGVEPTAWSQTLQSVLAPHTGTFSIMRGLCHRNAEAQLDGPGDHARSAACFLTGVHPKKTSGGDITAGVSVDQVAARELSGRTQFASLELGGEATMTAGNCDSGYSCAYSANISWRGAHTPSGKDHDPRVLFERLFAIGSSREDVQARARRIALRKSILDALSPSTAALRERLGEADRRKIDEYIDGVRDLEKRIETAERFSKNPNNTHENAGFVMPEGSPPDYTARIDLLADLAALALQSDRTRVISLMLANEGSNRSFPELGVADGHHEVSHHGDQADKREKFAKINRWQIERFARLIATLRKVEADGAPLLDNTMLLFGGAIADGNRHNHDDLPVVLAGGKALGFNHTGEHISPAGTPLCNLYVSMLNRVGVKGTRFGDSTGALSV